MIRTQTEQFLELFSRTFLRLKVVKILLHIIVLIVRGCFDRTHGLNKLFLHLMRALLMFNYDKPSRIFPCILLTRNHMIFLVQFGINKYLLIFSKTTNCTRLTGSCNFASLFKNLLGLIYSKLHSKSCDYLYEQSNNLHVRSRHRHCITERTWIPMVFKQAMASLNLLARLSLV